MKEREIGTGRYLEGQMQRNRLRRAWKKVCSPGTWTVTNGVGSSFLIGVGDTRRLGTKKRLVSLEVVRVIGGK